MRLSSALVCCLFLTLAVPAAAQLAETPLAARDDAPRLEELIRRLASLAAPAQETARWRWLDTDLNAGYPGHVAFVGQTVLAAGSGVADGAGGDGAMGLLALVRGLGERRLGLVFVPAEPVLPYRALELSVDGRKLLDILEENPIPLALTRPDDDLAASWREGFLVELPEHHPLIGALRKGRAVQLAGMAMSHAPVAASFTLKGSSEAIGHVLAD